MTKRNFSRKLQFLLLMITVFLVGFSSCRTSRRLPASRLKHISAEKLLDKARQNAFEFDDLTIRRINIQFSDEGTKASFRASLKATRDEKMLASITKLNIPVGRVLLSPDSILYINYIDKNYFRGDYSYLYNLLNFKISFNAVQSVVLNPIKTGIIDSARDSARFYVSVEDGRYVLQPENQSDRNNLRRGKISIRNYTKRTVFDDEELVIKKMMFNPQNFILEKLVLENLVDDRKMEVEFSDFVKVDGYDYPGAIDLKMLSGNELMELNIRLKGFSTEKIDSMELNIPERYQRVRIK